MARKRLEINNGVRGNLPLTLTRNAATVDDYAAPVAANAPRYGRTVAVADYTPWAIAYSTALQQVLCGSGKSADGQHSLIVFLLGDNTFNIAKDDNFSTLLASRSIRRTDKAVAINDIFQGTGNQDANRAWVPNYGTLCHGLLVLNTVVEDWNGTSWDIKGMGVVSLAIDATTGATTLVHRDFIADPSAAWLNYARGSYWAQTGYTPEPYYSDPVLTAWIVFTDYAANPGSPGGYAVIARATRSSIASAWSVEAATMVYSSILAGRHFHSAMAQIKSSTVIDVLISAGDAAQDQVFVARCNDKANYTNVANWTVYPHGDVGIFNQWAGGVLGPDSRHLVGADGTYETIVSIATPDAAVDPGIVKASHAYVFGLGTSVDNTTTNLFVHTDCPEKSRNYVSRSQPQNGTQDSSVCFSPDGRAWCMVAELPAGGEVPFISGGRIYHTTLSNNGGLKYIPIPRMRLARPLRIGPGVGGASNKQWTDANNWFIDQTQANITPTPLSKSGSNWQDTGVNLPAQPPVMGRVIKVVNTGANNNVGRMWIGGKWTGIGGPAPDIDTGPIFVRSWIAPLKGHQTTINTVADNGSGEFGPALTSYNGCAETFVPHIVTGNMATVNFGRWENESGMVQGGDYYLASDIFVTGTAGTLVPGYPMPEGRNTGNAGNPDEQVTVGGLVLAGRWAVSVAAIIPWDSWDSVWPGTMATEVPLWTLWTDANNHIAVVADIANSALLVRVTIAGVLTTITIAAVKYWRCYPIIVCVSRTDNGIEASCRVVGAIKTTTNPVAPTAIPTEIRFGSPAWARATALDLADVAIDDAAGLDATGRAALMGESSIPFVSSNSSFARTRPGRNPRVARV